MVAGTLVDLAVSRLNDQLPENGRLLSVAESFIGGLFLRLVVIHKLTFETTVTRSTK